MERGLSQESLAVDAAVDRGYVGGIERGTFNPTIEILDRLAIAFSIDIGVFFAVPASDEAEPAPMKSGRKRK